MRRRLLGSVVISLLIAFSSFLKAYAVDIPLEIYVQGGLTIGLNGDWFSGLIMENVEIIPGYPLEQTTSWNSVDLEDYISIADDTSTQGYHVLLSVEDYQYSGLSETQGPIPASNITLYGEYTVSGPAESSVGIDDETKTFSILPGSCAGATVDKFTLNSDLLNSETNYGIAGNNNPIILLTSTVDCLAKGNLRFDRAEMIIPEDSAVGDYTSNMTIILVDGLP